MSGNIEDFKGLSRRGSVQERKCAGDPVVRKCKSLPSSIDLYAVKRGAGDEGLRKKKSGRPKILRKTWDRFKGIIVSGPGGRERRVINNPGSSSAPSTPVGGDTFFGERRSAGGELDERDRIARNYALLQKRLSQEFRQSSLKGRNAAAGDGGFSDEFKRKLFEWESHPSRRKGAVKDPPGLSTRHLKELAWLDKQLEKIEAEKKRLELELKKQVEREMRVQKMKEAIRCSANDRVYNIRTENGVRTRVEGITSEYAMKVYEWEQKMGVAVELSALGYFDPKYRDDEDDKVGEEQRGGANGTEDDVVIGPLDLINERLKKLEDEGDSGQGLGERGAMLLAECRALEQVALGQGAEGAPDVDGRVSSTASSCCCSAEYEYEHTDSFATKNNSGASNTDSEVYEKRCTVTRRRSSECASNSDRGSPALSAFTSEDEEHDAKNDESPKRENAGVDEDKGREVLKPLCVKQIVIDEAEPSGFGGGSNVFVHTKRTIFSPVVEPEAGASCSGACSPRVVGSVPKSTYKPQPKTQFHRVFPAGNIPVWCSPIAARKTYNAPPGEFSIDRFLSERGVGFGRKLPPRTNAHLPTKYTIGGGYPPGGRNCIIARSSSFNGEKDERCCEHSVNDNGSVDDSVVAFGVSKSKSTGSIKRSIANMKNFLGFRGNNQARQGSADVDREDSCSERRGSKGFVRRLGAALLPRGSGNKDRHQQNGGVE